MARNTINPLARLAVPLASRRGAAAREVLVIGLGRFGIALGRTLVSLGHEVLGVDRDHRLVQQYASDLTQVVEADATDPTALRQIGAGDFGHAVVAIANDLEASILAVAALDDLGVGDIWAKALSLSHAKILQRVGAHHVVQPEHQMGERVAHLVTGRMMDFIALDEGFALVETAAPGELVGRSLAESGIRKRFGITVVCIKPAGGAFTYATPDTVVAEGDLLLVAGETAQCERFAELD